jgi:DNA polymerase-3 subunit epsilon
MRQIIFDTETTGLSPLDGHRVVEIGAIELNRGAITGNNFHVYINPERDMPEEAYRVHGISADFLKDKPVFADPSIGEAFLEFTKDAELIAHNAEFDMKFLQWELREAGLAQLDNPVTDTLKIARRKFPGSPASLDALCSRFGIDTAERERHGHGALLDSRLLAEVYIELTGGVQAGFDLSMSGEKTSSDGVAGATLQRSAPLSVDQCKKEQAAHAAFIGEMDNPLWAKFS